MKTKYGRLHDILGQFIDRLMRHHDCMLVPLTIALTVTGADLPGALLLAKYPGSLKTLPRGT